MYVGKKWRLDSVLLHNMLLWMELIWRFSSTKTFNECHYKKNHSKMVPMHVTFRSQIRPSPQLTQKEGEWYCGCKFMNAISQNKWISPNRKKESKYHKNLKKIYYLQQYTHGELPIEHNFALKLFIVISV